MPAPILIAYDATPHADDAIALARLLAGTSGAPLHLAHVHRADAPGSPSLVPRGREDFLRGEGERILARGAEVLGDPAVSRHAIPGTTTATALRRLAEELGAAILVFGSARDVPPGRAHPGSAARRLLHDGPTAIAFAPAGFRDRGVTGLAVVAVAHDDESGTVRRTAQLFAGDEGRLAGGTDSADLLIVGSRPDARPGRVLTNASSEATIQASQAPVLVIARDTVPDAAALAAA